MTFKEKYGGTVKDDLFKPTTGKKVYQIFSILFSELLGTFMVMILGCSGWLQLMPGTGIIVNVFPPLFEAAAGWAGAYGAMYVCLGHVSGFFLNPTLTVVMVIIGEMSIYRMLLYILFEVMGAVGGIMVLKFIAGGEVTGNYCLAAPAEGVPVLTALMMEGCASFFLAFMMCTIYDVRTKNTFDMGPFKLFVTLFAINLAFIRYSGCSVNPARSIGASVAALEFDTLWIYIAAPFSGAIVAGLIYVLLFNASIVDPGADAGPEEAG